MRILYQADGFLPSVHGGVEVLSWYLLKALVRRGHDVRVVSTLIDGDAPGLVSIGGLDVLKLDFIRALHRRDLAAIATAKKAIDDVVSSFGPDVLHLNDAMPSSFFFGRSGALAALPRLLTLHSPPRESGNDDLQNRLIADADRVVTVSQAQRQAFGATASANKFSVIHNALPIPDVMPAPLRFGPPRLLCLGRLVPDKGIDVAIRAVGRLGAKGVAVDLAIAGGGSQRPELEDLARELAPGRIRFLNWLDPADVPALINTATLVLMPSRWQEPFGLVALQAAQMGRPVVASAVGGLNEIVVHGETGLLVPQGDDTALADAIAQLLSTPKRALLMGANARVRAQEHFAFSGFVAAYEAIYKELVGNSRIPPVGTLE